ncbi:hypothetical protein KIF24_06775 [Micromonospora sp. Llam7]|uniref:hypothetical protein n=1 Tax=Micromonospora tarapacensis TaxID=2835305 RepID=UPI001C8387DE|nr:hypothetical protein [Micromonospora tarapacensis]MBX7265758.1 hypothetical protein [Micromonospora tarapacensis]
MRIHTRRIRRAPDAERPAPPRRDIADGPAGRGRDGPHAARAARRRLRRPTAALLSGAVLLSSGGCVDSAAENAREEITAHIDQVAADTTEWAQSDRASGDPPGIRDILDHIVATLDANARELGADVRNSDVEGTGSLGEVQVALEGTGSGWLWSQDQARYVFCARFEVTRSPGQPRKVSAEIVDCPPGAVPSGWNPTGPATPATTPS